MVLEKYLHRAIDRHYEKLVSMTHTNQWRGTWSEHPKLKGTGLKGRTLYCGDGGILLFLLHYGHYRRSQKALALFRKGLDSLISRVWDARGTGFVNSEPHSVLFLLTTVWKLGYPLSQQEKGFIDHLLKREQKRDFEGCKTDFLAGLAGSLLIYLLFFEVSRDKRCLVILKRLLEALFQQMVLTPKGCFFNVTEKMIVPVCGLAHGNAGIGYVLNELAYFFDLAPLKEVSKSCFEFERHHYKAPVGNWADYRAEFMFHPDDKACMHFMDLFGESRPLRASNTQMNAFCHGAAGIGLTRLRAWQLTRQPQYQREARIALKQVIGDTLQGGYSNSGIRGVVPCHGLSGNGELTLMAARLFRDRRYLGESRLIAARLLLNEKKHRFFRSYGMSIEKAGSSSDNGLGLFNGTTGIAYFYLRILMGDPCPRVLLPTVQPYGGKGCLTLDSGVLHGLVVKRHFPSLFSKFPDAVKSLRPRRGFAKGGPSWADLDRFLVDLGMVDTTIDAKYLAFAEQYKWRQVSQISSVPQIQLASTMREWIARKVAETPVKFVINFAASSSRGLRFIGPGGVTQLQFEETRKPNMAGNWWFFYWQGIQPAFTLLTLPVLKLLASSPEPRPFAVIEKEIAAMAPRPIGQRSSNLIVALVRMGLLTANRRNQ